MNSSCLASNVETESQVTHITQCSAQFFKRAGPSEKGTFSAVNRPSKGHN